MVDLSLLRLLRANASVEARVGTSACTRRSGGLADGRLPLVNIPENERTEAVTVEKHRTAFPEEQVSSAGGHIAAEKVGRNEDVRKFSRVT